jgi:hypothetical protein
MVSKTALDLPIQFETWKLRRALSGAEGLPSAGYRPRWWSFGLVLTPAKSTRVSRHRRPDVTVVQMFKT